MGEPVLMAVIKRSEFLLFYASKKFIPRSNPQVTSCTELLNIHGTIFNLSQHWSLEGRYAVKALKQMEPQVKQALQNLPKPVSFWIFFNQ